MNYKKVNEEIEELRCKLYKELEKNGFNSENVIKISKKLDNLIQNYYIEKNIKELNGNEEFHKEYILAINKLKRITKKNGKFPTQKEWNKIASKKYLNSKTIMLINGMTWSKVKNKIEKSIKE